MALRRTEAHDSELETRRGALASGRGRRGRRGRLKTMIGQGPESESVLVQAPYMISSLRLPSSHGSEHFDFRVESRSSLSSSPATISLRLSPRHRDLWPGFNFVT